jgi:hypothetical protein
MGGGAELYGTPGSTSEGVLQEMSSRAAVIFAGTVTAIKKTTDGDAAENAAASIVEVDFAIDHGVKGVAGSTYALREWGGLWRDSPRFTVGQRLLMLLHAPGPGGLSSPVDGLDGAIPIKAADDASTAAEPLSALQAGATDVAAQGDAVDLRWLQAKTLRVQTYADSPTAAPGESFAGLGATSSLGASASVAPATAAEPATTAGLHHVLGLLRAWQGTGNVSH